MAQRPSDQTDASSQSNIVLAQYGLNKLELCIAIDINKVICATAGTTCTNHFIYDIYGYA